MRDACLVTGGCGFLGSHVARHLINSGYEVIVLDDLSGGFVENLPQGANLHIGSITNAELVDNIFRHHSPRYVFHLAAYAAENLSPFIRVFNCRNNIEGSEVIINACINHDVECLVFTSSIAVYGNQTPPFYETTPVNPMDCYGGAKAYVETSLRNARELHGLNSVVFRPFNIYGPLQNIGDSYRNVVGIFMNQCLQHKSLTIFGDGQQTRAFSYVDDVAPSIAASVDRVWAWNQTYNIGGTTPYSVNNLAVEVLKVMDSDSQIIHLDTRHEAEHAHCDTWRFRISFSDTTAQVSLFEGLTKMAEWAKKRGPVKPSAFSKIEIHKNLPSVWQK